MANNIEGKAKGWQHLIVGATVAALALLCVGATITVQRNVAAATTQTKRVPSEQSVIAEKLQIVASNVEGLAFVDKTAAGAPLRISEARLKPISVGDYNREVTEKGLNLRVRDLILNGQVYAAFITVRNMTNRPISQCHLVFPHVGNVVVYLGGDDIGANESRLIEGLAVTETWDRETVSQILPVGETIEVAGVRFKDGSTWGTMPPGRGSDVGRRGITVTPLGEPLPPPPPPGPPPPQPPPPPTATARTVIKATP